MPADLLKSLSGDVRRGLCFRESFNGTANSVGNSVVSITGNPLIRNGVYNSTAGTGRYITYGAIPNQRDWTSSGFSVSFWLNVAQSTFDGTYVVILDNCGLSPNQGGFYIVLDDRGTSQPTNGFNVAFGTGTGGATSVLGKVSNCISDSTWEHFVVVFSTTSIAIYKNGAALSVTNSGSGTGYLPTFANMRFGGRSSDGATSLRAQVKDVQIFTGQLTAQEALELYAGSSTQFLQHAYALHVYNEKSYQPTTATFRDLSGNNRPLTIGDGSTAASFPAKTIRCGMNYVNSDYMAMTGLTGISNSEGTIAWNCSVWNNSATVLNFIGETATKNNVYVVYDSPTTGRLLSYDNASSLTTVMTGVSLGTGVQRTVAVSWDASNFYLYIDGKLSQTAARPANTTLSNSAFMNLGQLGGAFYLGGFAYGDGIWNQALTAREHAMLHQFFMEQSVTV